MIEVHGLSKQYGPVQAVRDVSFSVGAEQVLGFLGPNGAGKTTIMKVLTGFHFPSAGDVLIDGISVQEESVAVKRRIGYLPESVPLYGDLTPNEYLGFIAEARLIPAGERKGAIDAAIDACGLGQVRFRRIETLSKGYKQRVGLAQAIIHDPPILILDEPTTGLDPNQIIEIRSLIKELGKRKTVILSTHILQEVEAVCSRVMIINEGRIAAQGTTEEIAATMKGGDTWELILKGAELPAKLPADILCMEERLARLALNGEALSSVSSEALSDGALRLSFLLSGGGSGDTGSAALEGGDSSIAQGERIFDWAVAQGFKILRMNRKKLSLEDIFVKLTSDEGISQRITNDEGVPS